WTDLTDSPETAAGYVSILHALDHLTRMNQLVRTNMKEIEFTRSGGKAHEVVDELRQALTAAIEALSRSEPQSVVEELGAFSQQLAAFRKQERANTFDVTANGEVSLRDAFNYVRLVLLIDSIAYH